ncbi:hypothetical protein N0V88_002214 [Collariella sp. IMI 366227]|nr:hypothetical protein N0V88_002214 [Collariella sp. IMI 366227]
MNGTHPPPPNNISHNGATDIHQPFTTAERIQQLSNIDNPHPGGTTTPTNDDDATSSSDPLEAFRSSQTSFFNTIDRIDKHLTRQILAMEEAGIITLRSGGGVGETEAQAVKDVVLERGREDRMEE